MMVGLKAGLEDNRDNIVVVQGRRPSVLAISVLTLRQQNLPLQKMTSGQMAAFINFVIANFSQGVLYSLLAPFFPQEAQVKGASIIQTGMIFGVFEISILISSLIFGNYIGQIGPKFMYCAGLFVASGSAILFGILEYCPGGQVFVLTAFVLRLVEGIGAGAFITASFTIICTVFTDRVTSAIGTLEFFTGLGLMLGPVAGGALYQVGGFKLPFFVMGSGLMAVAGMSIWLLPSPPISGVRHGSLLSLLRIPPVVLSGWLFIAGAGCTGFLEVALGLHLRTVFNLSPLFIGLMFVIQPTLYGVSTIVYGAIVDKKSSLSGPVICAGYCCGAVGLMLLGPAPFLPIRSDILWLVIFSLVMVGLGFGTLVSSFRISTDALRSRGYEESIEIYGLLNGFISACYATGAFAGPLVGGVLVNSLGFAWTSFAFGLVLAVSAGLTLVYTMHGQTANGGSPTETVPLLLPTE